MTKRPKLVKDWKKKPDKLIDENFFNLDGTLKKKTENCWCAWPHNPGKYVEKELKTKYVDRKNLLT